MEVFHYKHGDRPLEGYTIQRALGRGGFGEVYYALSDSGREVALKAIQSYEQIELRGVSQCMNLKSPHLVTIFDVRHNEQGVPFVVMEYVAGPSLRELIDGSPAGLGVPKSAFFLREIAKGLTYLHDRGIVHRDLKPGNIFYEDGYVKIGDYGLSKAMSASQHSGQTITVGTVHYMAPEIGQGRYDSSIDVYALGIMLYEMLTGQTPFLGASAGEILMKHLASEPDLAGIDEPFAAVIKKAMAKDPAERYASAQEMVEAVFGTEHIRNSVSHFSLESLSMAAERIGKKVAVGGPGSSAEHAGQLGGEPAGGAGRPGSDPWASFAQQMDAFGRRMGKWGEEVGERMAQVGSRIGDRMAGRATTPVPRETPQAALAVDPARDPLDWNQRRMLGIFTAAVVAVGAGFLSHERPVNPVWLALFAFAAIGGAAGGIVAVRVKYLSALARESHLIQRLAFGGGGCLFGLLFSLTYLFSMGAGSGRANVSVLFIFVFGAVFAYLRKVTRAADGPRRRADAFGGRLIYFGPLAIAVVAPLFGVFSILEPSAGLYHGISSSGLQESIIDTLLSGGVAMFLVNWRKLTSPARGERVALGAAFGAGLMAWFLGHLFDGIPLLAAGILAGVALVAQVVSPFDPFTGRRRSGRAAGEQDVGPRADGVGSPYATPQAAGVVPPHAGRRHGAEVPPLGGEADARYRQGASGGVRIPYMTPAARLTPTWAKALFLIGFIGLFGTGIMLLFWAGLAHFRDPLDPAMAVAFGIGCLMLALFCLVRAVWRTYRSWWGSFVRPVLMLVCVQAILASAIFLGAARNLHEEDILVGLGFIIFPAILFIVFACIPNRAFSDVSQRAVALAALAAPPVSSRRPGVSTRLQLWALLLACAGFLPFAGLHRFYVGKIGTGILWLFTAGFLGIGTIIDIICIATGHFRDKHGLPLLTWDKLDNLKPGDLQAAAAYQGGAAAPAPDEGAGREPASYQEGESAYAAYQGGAKRDSGSDEAAWPHGPYMPYAPPRLTGTFLSVVGGLVMTFGFVLGLLVAVNLPAIVAAGWPDPSLNAETAKLFGYAGWPHLVQRMGMVLTVVTMGLGTLLLLIARRKAGAGHVSRAMLGALSLVFCLQLLSGALPGVNWPMVVDLANHDRIGLAGEAFLDQVAPYTRMAIFSGILLLVGLMLIIWPERRPTAGPVGTSDPGAQQG